MTLERRVERLLGSSLRHARQWPGRLRRTILWSAALLCTVVLAGVISAPASLSQQALLGLLLVVAALVLRRFEGACRSSR